MIKKQGYFVKFSAHIDERVCLALFDYANKLNITPDLAVEQLIEKAYE